MKFDYQMIDGKRELWEMLDAGEMCDRITWIMLQNHCIPWALPVDYFESEESCVLRYQTGTLETLADVMNRPISRDRFFRILQDIVKIYADEKRFLLKKGSVKTDVFSMFADTEGRVYALVDPIVTTVEQMSVLRFFKGLVESARINGTGDTSYVYEISGMLESMTEFHAESFLLKLRQIKSACDNRSYERENTETEVLACADAGLVVDSSIPKRKKSILSFRKAPRQKRVHIDEESSPKGKKEKKGRFSEELAWVDCTA